MIVSGLRGGDRSHSRHAVKCRSTLDLSSAVPGGGSATELQSWTAARNHWKPSRSSAIRSISQSWTPSDSSIQPCRSVASRTVMVRQGFWSAADLAEVCDEYFGEPRQKGTSHRIYRTPRSEPESARQCPARRWLTQEHFTRSMCFSDVGRFEAPPPQVRLTAPRRMTPGPATVARSPDASWGQRTNRDHGDAVVADIAIAGTDDHAEHLGLACRGQVHAFPELRQ